MIKLLLVPLIIIIYSLVIDAMSNVKLFCLPCIIAYIYTIHLLHFLFNRKYSFITYTTPYIQIDTPFGEGVRRRISLVAVILGPNYEANGYPSTILARSELLNLVFYVEASSRPQSYAYLVPGIETSGKYIIPYLIYNEHQNYVFDLLIFKKTT